MRNRDKVLASGLFGLTMALVSMTCTNPSGGTATETGNVSGIVYNANGSPAANATVHFYPVSYNPYTGGLGKTRTLGSVAIAASLDSTRTDSKGNYSATLDSGSYNLLASGDSGLACRDSIATVKGAVIHPCDTLKTPGSIAGVIEMAGGGNPETVFIIFMGTGSVWFPSDTLGNFATGKMAPGSYHIRFLTTLPNYNVLDTTLTVTAGKIDRLGVPIQLRYNGIPVPQGLHILYDSLKEIVTLLWNKPTTGTKVANYNVYRELSDSTSYDLIKSGVLDTTYQDSTGVQGLTCEYRVSAVDTNSSEGVKCGAVEVAITSIYKLIRVVGGQGTGNGQFSDITAIAVDSSQNVYATDMLEVYPRMSERVQKFNGNGVFVLNWSSSTTMGTGYFVDGSEGLSLYKDSLLYMSSPQNSDILAFDLMGNLKFQFNVNTLDYSKPGTIAFLDTGFFITDNRKIYNYSMHGNFISSWNVPDQDMSGWLAVTRDGYVCLQQESDSLTVYTPGGALQRQVRIQPVTKNNGLASGISKDLYISDEGNNLVWEIDEYGNTISRFAISSPTAIVVSSKGLLYVASQNNQINIYQRD